MAEEKNQKTNKNSEKELNKTVEESTVDDDFLKDELEELQQAEGLYGGSRHRVLSRVR